MSDPKKPAKAKKPSPDFVVRLVGGGVRPWDVSFRNLANVLNAVQRLVDQKDDDASEDFSRKRSDVQDAMRVLHLVDVKSGSASYNVAAPNPAATLKLISDVGDSLSRPTEVDWNYTTISSIRHLADSAKALGCEIEFRRFEKGKAFGGIIAKITPQSYREVARSSFVRGYTSVFAKVERVGGVTDMFCGIRLPDDPRKMVICRVTSVDLVRRLGGYIYRHVTLSGKGVWLRRSLRLLKLDIESCDGPKTGSILDALKKSHDAGGFAWDSVDDPATALAEIRGE